MRVTVVTGVVFLTLVFLAAGPAHAWSNKEHIQFTRIAAARLIARADTPPAMKEWLRQGIGRPMTMDEEREYFLNKRIGIIPRDVDGLLYWVVMPDMVVLTGRQEKVEPWGVPERPLHFIDVEYFMPDPARRSYAHDLSNKPALADFPDDPKDARYARAGMLPFRVRESYQQMVKAIRDGRLADKPGQYPRDEHATKWAGYLAHYLQDNTQPQHATADYKAESYFADKRRPPNVHSEMEYRMCDDEHEDHMAVREDFWPLFAAALEKGEKDPVETDDLWRATLEVALISYDALPLIGRAAMAAAKQGGTPEKPEGPAQPFDTEAFFRFKGKVRDREMTVMEMKAIQTAWAVQRVERVWLQAWREAAAAGPANAAPQSP